MIARTISRVRGFSLWPRRRWRHFWSRAPRQLRFTFEGKVVVGLALAVGAAAINTGNNLLMLSWGLVLSAIVISGLLSEGTLRPLRLVPRAPREARAREVAALPVGLENLARRLPAFGVEATVAVATPSGRSVAHAHYLLRVEPGQQTDLLARFVPERRGLHEIVGATAKTSYPFGFFEKSRRFAGCSSFWVFPYAVDIRHLTASLVSQLGEESAQRVGGGEDFFSLRPYRAGDDLRRVHWRRAARAGRWFVREQEAKRGLEVLLELALPGVGEARAEHGIATLGSLAEELLGRGLRVGVRAPGVLILPEAGMRQRARILTALARLDRRAALPILAAGRRLSRVALAVSAGTVLDGADLVLPIPEPVTRRSGAPTSSACCSPPRSACSRFCSVASSPRSLGSAWRPRRTRFGPAVGCPRTSAPPLA